MLVELTVGVTDSEGVTVTVVGVADVGEIVGVVVGVGVTVGVVGTAGVVDGGGIGVTDGVGVDVVTDGDWIGRTRLDPGMRRPVSISAIARAAMTLTAVAPPVERPAAKTWRSRRYSVSRRSRSLAGSAARRAAQLLNGAAAMPSVGTNSSPASSGPLSSIPVGTRRRGSSGMRLRCQCWVPSASHSSHR